MVIEAEPKLPDEPADDNDYDQPWWGKFLPSGRVQLKKKRRTVIADCRRMLRYALDEGGQIPATLAEDIALIDGILSAAGRRPLSEVPEDVLAESAAMSPKTVESAPGINEVILRTHNALSNLVAPATAQSLRATDPAIVLFGLPPIAKFAIVGAIACTVAFLAAVSKPLATVITNQTDKPQVTTTASPTPTPVRPSPTATP
jgi:hypothetical protein